MTHACKPGATNLVPPPDPTRMYVVHTLLASILVFELNPSTSSSPVRESKLDNNLSSRTLLMVLSAPIVDESASTLASPQNPHDHPVMMLFFASQRMFLSTSNRFFAGQNKRSFTWKYTPKHLWYPFDPIKRTSTLPAHLHKAGNVNCVVLKKNYPFLIIQTPCESPHYYTRKVLTRYVRTQNKIGESQCTYIKSDIKQLPVLCRILFAPL